MTFANLLSESSAIAKALMHWYLETLSYYPLILRGVEWTVEVSILSMLLSSVVGCAVALLRLSRHALSRWIGSFYVDFFCTTPLLVQLVWIYYALPILTGLSLSDIQAGVLGLSLYTGAFLSEAIRAGILSIAAGQREAAMALGMTTPQWLRRIILPQAVVRMLPSIAGILMTLIKDSSLTSVVAVPELMRQMQVLSSYMQRNMEPLTVAAVIYFCLTWPISVLVNGLHRRFNLQPLAPQRATTGS